MAKYPFFQLPSQYFLNLLIIRGDSMDNVEFMRLLWQHYTREFYGLP